MEISRQNRNREEVHKTVRVSTEEKFSELASFCQHLQPMWSARDESLIHGSGEKKDGFRSWTKVRSRIM